jgi:hypothetical protein
VVTIREDEGREKEVKGLYVMKYVKCFLFLLLLCNFGGSRQ